MKKIFVLTISLLTLLSFNNYSYAQDFGNESTMSKKEARKAAKAAHKAAEAAQQKLLFEQAKKCLENGTFVLEADQLLFPKGLSKFVSSITNFISMNNGEAVIQISTSNYNPGPNGVGGITVEGTVSDVTMQTDKKGRISYNFSVQGIAISATVNMQLSGDGNRATVTVYPNFNSNNVTMTGILVPYNKSSIFQGRTF